MFVGSINLKYTNFELVIVPLMGTELRGQWKANTDSLLLCHLQSGRFCICGADDHFSRFQEKLGIGEHDAKNLAEWVAKTFGPEDN